MEAGWENSYPSLVGSGPRGHYIPNFPAALQVPGKGSVVGTVCSTTGGLRGGPGNAGELASISSASRQMRTFLMKNGKADVSLR